MRTKNENNNSISSGYMIKYSSFRIPKRDVNNDIPKKALNNKSQIKSNDL